MVFTIYISYSRKDKDLVNSLYSVLKQSGVNVHAVETSALPRIEKEPLAGEIKKFISTSDYVFVLLTKDAVESPNVFIELGMARALSKPIMLIVEPNVQLPRDIGDLPYIIMDRDDPDSTLRQVKEVSSKLKLEKEKGNPVAGIIFLLLALGFLSWLSSDEE